MSDPEASFAAMELFRAKLRSRVGLPLVGVGVQLADPISTDAMATCSDFIWYDQVRVCAPLHGGVVARDGRLAWAWPLLCMCSLQQASLTIHSCWEGRSSSFVLSS